MQQRRSNDGRTTAERQSFIAYILRLTNHNPIFIPLNNLYVCHKLFPLFQETFKDGFQAYNWAVLPVLYPNGVETVKELYAAGGQAAVDGVVGTTVDPSVVAANPNMMIAISALALITNIIAFAYIMYQAKVRSINPYKEDVFVDQKYYKDAMARAVVNS